MLRQVSEAMGEGNVHGPFPRCLGSLEGGEGSLRILDEKVCSFDCSRVERTSKARSCGDDMMKVERKGSCIGMVDLEVLKLRFEHILVAFFGVIMVDSSCFSLSFPYACHFTICSWLGASLEMDFCTLFLARYQSVFRYLLLKCFERSGERYDILQ